MIPHTLVLEPGLVIYTVYNGYWFWGRPSPEDLRRDLREVTRRCRPDWDLGAPGLREASEAGDKSGHYPQGIGPPSHGRGETPARSGPQVPAATNSGSQPCSSAQALREFVRGGVNSGSA